MILQTQNDILFCNLTGALRDGEKTGHSKTSSGVFPFSDYLEKKNLFVLFALFPVHFTKNNIDFLCF